MIHETSTSSLEGNSNNKTRLTSKQIADAAEGTPMADNERPVHDIDQLSKDAHKLHDCLQQQEREGHGRSIPYPGWIEEHIPLLDTVNQKLVTVIIQDTHAIEMADKMFALMRARQEQKITGAHQDIEFGRIVAKKHFPIHTHEEIDKKANENIAKTTDLS